MASKEVAKSILLLGKCLPTVKENAVKVAITRWELNKYLNIVSMKIQVVNQFDFTEKPNLYTPCRVCLVGYQLERGLGYVVHRPNKLFILIRPRAGEKDCLGPLTIKNSIGLWYEVNNVYIIGST